MATKKLEEREIFAGPSEQLPEGVKYPDLEWCQKNVYRLTQYYIEANYPDFYAWLMRAFPEDMRLSERLYRFYHPNENNVCVLCGKPTSYINFSKGFNKHCSTTCTANDKKTRDKQKATSLKKYGVENPSQAQSVKDKQKATFKERYGVEHALQHKEFREKAKQTTMKNFGVYYPGQSEEVKEKIRATNIEKYGAECSFQAEEVKEKIRATNIERLGVEYPMQSKDVRDKAKVTIMDKYGVEYASQSPEIQEKIRATNIEKYGVESPLQNPDILQKVVNTNIERYGVPNPLQNKEVVRKSIITRQQRQIQEIEHLVGFTDDDLRMYKCPHPECDKCQEKYFITPYRIYYDRIRAGEELCTRLLPIQQSHSKNTSIEIFIQRLLDEHGVKYETSNKKLLGGKELDIYIPELNLAIECNGIYWHSERHTEPSYHLDKLRACQERGIRLIYVWEDWVVRKPDIVRSMLLAKIGKTPIKINARDCEVCEVQAHEAREFLESNHIQGFTSYHICLGLREPDGKLACIMTFGRKRACSGNNKSSEGEWDLSRFCSRTFTCVRGGASKLLTYFIREYNPSSIFSFSSNDISDGGLYESLGFVKDGPVQKSYWYVNLKIGNRYERKHRSSFTKKRIIAMGMAPDPDPSKWTEREAMKASGWTKIIDSGLQKWTLNLSKQTI